MKAVVTGAAGFLGSHIADALTARGFEVTLFDIAPSRYQRDGQTMVVGDICDADAVAAAIAGANCVYHLAGLSDLNAARSRPADTVQLNVAGTVNVLEACRTAGVKRFLFASTVYVYSREGGFYRCSKQACEAYIEEYQRYHGLEYTVLRYGSLYGPRADASNGVFRLLNEAVTTGSIHHNGSADEVREYIHVEDAARLSVEALSPEYANTHLTITGHYPMRISDLFTMFSEILGRELNVEYAHSAGEMNGHYRVTPYTYTPKVGRKLTGNCYVDMGQGLLQILDEMHHDNSAQVTAR